METLGYGSGINSRPTEVKFEEEWVARKLWDRCMQYKKDTQDSMLSGSIKTYQLGAGLSNAGPLT
jgi:hypothetical protein